MDRIKVGVSSCLLGEEVRHDGNHQLDRYITETLGEFFEWVPVCPEVEYGLGVPREALRLVGDPSRPKLVGRRSGTDHTEGMKRWADGRLKGLEGEGLSGFIFKARSPSSGPERIKIYGEDGSLRGWGRGVFAGAFMDRFPLVPVIDDGRLHDPALRENFIERVFVYRRWRDFLASRPGEAELVEFHTDHKLLVMSHSPELYRELGRMVAGQAGATREELPGSYIEKLTEAMRTLTTPGRNANVLNHAAGYFRKRLTPDERQELAEVIDGYRRGLVPLVVPVILIKHYTRKYDEPYLKRQYYLNPHPMELKLRNHA